jgi:hypothetical protein
MLPLLVSPFKQGDIVNKSISCISKGISVSIEQVADLNYKGTVFLLHAPNRQGWGYGRGDTHCKEILSGIKDFQELADKYTSWLNLGGN